MNQPADTRHVLVIAYYFPPMGLSGVQRTLKFVKHLPSFGWHPTVLTVEPSGYLARDETLLDDLHRPGIRVVRTRAAGPGRIFGRRNPVVKMPRESRRKLLSMVSDTVFIPDNKIGWRRTAVSTALRLHNERPFDLVFATAPPFTDFLIGTDVKRAINKPLVFDYRDPWTDYPFRFNLTPFHRARHASLERKALRQSSHVVTTSRRVKEILIQRHPFLSHHDVDIIPQGYDPEDFDTITPRPRVLHSRGVMRVTYAGVFWEDRVPDHFLRGLKQLFERRPDLRGRIEARFVGTFREEHLGLIRSLGLAGDVTVIDYLPHRECIRELLEADVLWMIVGDDLGTPGKLYEYIGARKPILACVPEGFIRSTALEAGGVVVDPEDAPAISQALEGLFAQFESGTLRGPAQEVAAKYDRRRLTGNLVRVFESLFEP